MMNEYVKTIYIWMLSRHDEPFYKEPRMSATWAKNLLEKELINANITDDESGDG